MKKIYLIIVLAFIANIAIAQPSDAAVTKKVRERYKAGNIQLNGASTTKEFENGVWHYYYWRHFTVTAKGADGISGTMTGAVKYEKSGNSYTFDNYATGETTIEGIKNPSDEELLNYLETNLQEFLGGAYNDIVGETPKISILKEPKFKWKNPEHLVFFAKVIYSRKVSYTEIEKAEHIYETHIFRKGMDGDWNRVLADEVEGKKKVISKTSYTTSEIDAMKTLQDIDIDNQAKAAMSSLPKVANAPVFATEKQLFYYIHEKLMSSDAKTAKAYLYSVMSKNCFETGIVLNQRDEEWMNKICDNISTYQKTHCLYPSVKEEQYGAISFYDKEKRRNTRFVGSLEDGTWKIRTITYYPASSDDVQRMEAIQGNCEGKPDLTVKEVKKYEIGDVVDVTVSNTIYTAKVVKKDASFDNRYYVKCINFNRSYWVNDDQMKPAEVQSTSEATKMGSVSETPKAEEASFKVGDKVKVRTRSGDMNGKIIKSSGSKFLVKLSDPRYQDMWVAPSNLILR